MEYFAIVAVGIMAVVAAVYGFIYWVDYVRPCWMCDETGRGISDAGELIDCVFCSGKGMRR